MFAVRRAAVVVAALIGIAVAVVPAASADRRDISVPNPLACGFGAATPVFGAWGDSALYALAPQGDLARTDAWLLGRTSLSTDHDPFSPSAQSLTFADGGGWAISPPMCVTAANPSIRFFARDAGLEPGATIRVELLTVNGRERHQTIARFQPSADWAPSPVIQLGLNFTTSPTAYVAFAFRVDGLRDGETVNLDGLYVDPFAWR